MFNLCGPFREGRVIKNQIFFPIVMPFDYANV